MIPINPSGSSFDANETLGAGRDPHDSETTHPVDEAEHPVHPDEAGLLAQALPPVPGPKYEQVIRLLEQRYIIPGSPGDKLPTELQPAGFRHVCRGPFTGQLYPAYLLVC